MKTHSSPIRYLVVTLAFSALSAATLAKAGPGFPYWKSHDDVRVETRIPTAAPVSLAVPACADAKLVQSTELKKGWPNARGPLTAVITSSRFVCTSCVSGTTVAKRSWPNGKGPMVSTAVTASHDCINCGTPQKI